MKIKIINLLNKIFNCEKIPRKIIFDDYIWNYCDNFQDYFNVYNGYLFDVLINDYNIKEFLNVEVEIVEEPKKIDNFIENEY